MKEKRIDKFKKRKETKKFNKSKYKNTYVIISIVLTGISALFCLSLAWTLEKFANLSMDKIVYELNAPLEGTGDGLVGNYIQSCVITTIIIVLIYICILFSIRGKTYFKCLLKVSIILSAVIIIASISIFIKVAGVTRYFADQYSDTKLYEKDYINPNSVNLEFPEKKRNLIYIYAESMEASYTDKANGGGTNINYIPELTNLAKENEDFSGSDKSKLNGGISYPGTTWTMAGILAQTSGLPLNTVIDDNAMTQQNSFFPKILTLGDILEEQGYKQVFSCGSDAKFGGRQQYFKDHGNYEFLDLKEVKKQKLLPKDYYVFWGYEDSKLFDYAKDRISQLAKGEEPFNYTLLTVNTHASSGYIEKQNPCKYGDFSYGNSIDYSSKQINDFISWIKTQSFFENTTIIICGDHTSMAPSIAQKIDKDYLRKTYCCVINPYDSVSKSHVRREYSTLDLFPTTLAALGVNIPKNRLGLGTNLFSMQKTITEKYGYDKVNREISRKSKLLSNLESIDKDTQKIINKFKGLRTSKEIKAKGDVEIKTSWIKQSKDLSDVKIKVWYYDKSGRYVHNWLDGNKDENDCYHFKITNDPDFKSAEKFSYQIVAQTKKGYVNIGDEGVVSYDGIIPKIEIILTKILRFFINKVL